MNLSQGGSKIKKKLDIYLLYLLNDSLLITHKGKKEKFKKLILLTDFESKSQIQILGMLF